MASGAESQYYVGDLTGSLLAKFRFRALKTQWPVIEKSSMKVTADGFRKHAMSQYSEWFGQEREGHSEALSELDYLCKIMVSEHLSEKHIVSTL